MSISVRLLFLLAFAPTLLAARPAEVLPKHPVVASANAAAADAGLEILAAGGNAFDAAVAVSATLGLVEPESSGLGGGGFILIRRASDGHETFIDARERAPLAATRDMYLDAEGKPERNRAVNGALAAAIPGMPAALDHLARNYGRFGLDRSLGPAIRLAREGWKFGAKNHAMMGYRKDLLAKDPGAAALLLIDGEMPQLGSVMRNPDYAATLQLLQQHGAAGFYTGEFATRLVEGVRAVGGIWSEQDLAEYRLVERAPLSIEHRGYRIVTAPPPSSGGIALAQVLQILQGYDYTALERVPRLHLTIEALRRAYRDRAIFLGDPDFVTVPTELLSSAAYAAGLRAGIHPDRATPSDMLPGVSIGGSEDTTHFSIIDTEGNLVAITQTVNLPYGNGVVVPGTGFLLNNEMDDFSIKPGVPNAYGLVGEDANAIAPGKRPLSSMTPSFLIGEKRVAVLGTPGGSRIISMVLFGLMQLMEGAGAQAAADAPRIHHQYLPDVVQAEPDALSETEIVALQARGFTIQPAQRPWGNMQIALWHRLSGEVEAGTDPRWKGVGKAGIGEASIYR